MSDVVVVYITTTTPDEAKNIARTVVTEHLAACANIIDGMQSFYHWEGECCNDEESIIICKSHREMLAPLVARIRQLHSSTCPCIVAYPVIGGNPDYLAWVEQEVILSAKDRRNEV